MNFKCLNCGKEISLDNLIGTLNRNHCPFCLYSKHVDQDIAGDRKSKCQNLMEPIGLTFKHEGKDKYGKEKQGEIMVIHKCLKDQKISINRIAGDDEPEIILKVFKNSQNLNLEIIQFNSNLQLSLNGLNPKFKILGIKKELKKTNIELLTDEDKNEIRKQLFGKINVF